MRILFDLETNGLLETVSKVHCMCAVDVDSGVTYSFRPEEITEGLDLLRKARVLIGHNIIKYDLNVIQKLYPQVGDTLKKKTIVDTLVYARLAYGDLPDRDFAAIRAGRLNQKDFTVWSGGKTTSAVGSNSLEAWGKRLKVYKGAYGKKDYVLLEIARLTELVKQITTDHTQEIESGRYFPKLEQAAQVEEYEAKIALLKEELGRDVWETFSEDMLKYCEQDIKVNLALYKLLESKEVPIEALDLEMKVAEIIDRQERHGWAFDVGKAQILYGKLCQRRTELTEELQKLFPGWYEELKTPEYYLIEINNCTYKAKTKKELEDLVYKEFYGKPLVNLGEGTDDPKKTVTRKWISDRIQAGPNRKNHIAFNPGSRHHIARALKEAHGWIPTEFTETGEPVVDEDILSSLKYPEARTLSEYFVVGKRIGQLAEGNQSWLGAEKKGRIHGRLNTLGAVTGRSTHQHPNLAQVPNPKPTKEYPEGKPYARECRELFTVSKGFSMVGTDASGQELRCLAHYMHQFDGGEYGTTIISGDIHTKNQLAAGLVSRDHAKTFIYGYLYGAGDAKIGLIVEPKAPEEERKKIGRKLKKQFLEATPALKELRISVVTEAEDTGYITSLDLRKIPIRSPHAALNSLLQSTGAILTKRWMVFIDEELKCQGLDTKVFQLGFVHDELIFEIPEGLEEAVKQICIDSMVKTEKYYDFKCPLGCEVKIGKNWSETH